MKLYNYFRSSASFRVRIAMALKGLKYEYVPVHIARGEHKGQAFAALSPDMLVPLLEVDGQRLTQSMAIIEYLDDKFPAVPMVAVNALEKAQIRALAQSIACEIHPINNVRVLKYLSHELKVTEEAKTTWYRHWVRDGLESFERQLQALDVQRAGRGLAPSVYCFGDMPTLADCCLVPQIFNGQRFNANFEGLPRTMGAFDACMALEAFQQAKPANCPDFEP